MLTSNFRLFRYANWFKCIQTLRSLEALEVLLATFIELYESISESTSAELALPLQFVLNLRGKDRQIFNV